MVAGHLARRLDPSVTNQNYLVLRSRRHLLEREITAIASTGARDLVLLDIGGSGKPYAPLFKELTRMHVAVDIDGSADIYGEGGRLPVRTESIDIVVCTAVLEHVPDPWAVTEEFRRVLKHGGIVFLSVPAVFPIHDYPMDNWRFMPGGLRLLLNGFDDVRVIPEGANALSFFRTLNLFIAEATSGRSRFILKVIAKTFVFPIINLFAWWVVRPIEKRAGFAASWLVVATRPVAPSSGSPRPTRTEPVDAEGG